MRHLCLVLALSWLTSPSFADEAQTAKDTDRPSLVAADLAWLAGHWAHRDGGRTSEEIWLPPTANMMLGVNQTTEDGTTRGFEFLRIEIRDTGTVYSASPGGREPTPFELVSAGEMTVTFENPEHDFPQRIIYRREGDRLHARIEGTADGKERSSAWFWDLVRE